MHILLVAGLLSLVCGLGAAETLDVYMSVPVIVDRSGESSLNATAIGGGVKFSTVEYDEMNGEYDDIMGFGAALTAYYPLALSQTQNGVSVSSVSELYSVPLGLDLFLGLDVTKLQLGLLTFPLGIGAHSKAEFYKEGFQMNFGLAGFAGAHLDLGDLGIFARVQVSCDFYGTQNMRADGKWHGGVMNHWGIQPQVGISFLD